MPLRAILPQTECFCDCTIHKQKYAKRRNVCLAPKVNLCEIHFENPWFSILSDTGKLQFPRPPSHFVARTLSHTKQKPLLRLLVCAKRRTGASSKVESLYVSAAA